MDGEIVPRPRRDPMRPERWKFAYTTRRVSRDDIAGVVSGDHAPRAGDVVLAEVLETGQHRRLELVDGRRAVLFAGDRIVVSYGNRYAPDQFEGIVPLGLEPCELVATGGVAAHGRRGRRSLAARARAAGGRRLRRPH